jgi:hypothetical protein
MNYIKITYNVFVVKNQNGFNNALYDFMRVDEGCFYSKQELISMGLAIEVPEGMYVFIG